jgi:magnesium chelatase family protein
MSYEITYSRAYVGVDAPLVSVETHLSGGLPALTIVGIAGKVIYVIGEAMLL